VYVPGGSLQSSEIVPFEDKHYIMINEFDVAIVW
jgi:hypothetical protein